MPVWTLKSANSKRGKINAGLYKTLHNETQSWGIEIVGKELKQIDPPSDVQETMNKVVKAESEKIVAIDSATAAETVADGIKRAKIKEAEGTILSHPSWDWFIVSLSRGGETDHARIFLQALQQFEAKGVIRNLNTINNLNPLNETELKHTILALLPEHYFSLVICHYPAGEYTDHNRHDETGKALILLWHSGIISVAEFRTFANEDGKKSYLPRPIETVGIYKLLTKRIWKEKQSIITEIYGFDLNSFEAKTTIAESLGPFSSSIKAKKSFR